MELLCRKCRTFLTDESQLDLHSDENAKCTSFFLKEPPAWQSLPAGTNDGKLFCPQCNSRLGSWCWSGITCSCGKWITPAFQLHISRIDDRKQSLPANVGNHESDTEDDHKE